MISSLTQRYAINTLLITLMAMTKSPEVSERLTHGQVLGNDLTPVEPVRFVYPVASLFASDI